jgi:hypothetical protein
VDVKIIAKSKLLINLHYILNILFDLSLKALILYPDVT